MDKLNFCDFIQYHIATNCTSLPVDGFTVDSFYCRCTKPLKHNVNTPRGNKHGEQQVVACVTGCLILCISTPLCTGSLGLSPEEPRTRTQRHGHLRVWFLGDTQSWGNCSCKDKRGTQRSHKSLYSKMQHSHPHSSTTTTTATSFEATTGANNRL